MIRTVIFDLGNVIIPFDFKRGYAGMAALCGLPPEEVRARVASTDLVKRFESGQVGAHEFVEELCGQIGHPIGYEQFCEIWSSIFLPEPLIRLDLVQRIKRTCRTLILSNTNPIHWKMLEATYPILSEFDDRILSHEVKAMKPAAAIYAAALSKANCAPEECFFTDDVAAYVEGAQGHGIQAVQFESGDQIERELIARGLPLNGAARSAAETPGE